MSSAWAERGICVALGILVSWWIRGASREDNYETGADSDEGEEVRSGRRRRTVGSRLAAAPTEELKMVLVVNDELKMGKGKIGGSTDMQHPHCCRGPHHAVTTSAATLALVLASSAPRLMPMYRDPHSTATTCKFPLAAGHCV